MSVIDVGVWDEDNNGDDVNDAVADVDNDSGGGGCRPGPITIDRSPYI